MKYWIDLSLKCDFLKGVGYFLFHRYAKTFKIRKVVKAQKCSHNVKLKRLKGIAHDLAHHLTFEIWIQRIEVPTDFTDTNILEKENSFDEYCVHFFQERLPASFDFQKIERIDVRVNRLRRVLHVAVDVKVDGRMFFSDAFSCSLESIDRK